MSSSEQLRALVQANLELTSAPDLHDLLVRLVRAARELVRARYAALGVLSESGDGLVDFVHSGFDREQLERLGDLPRGHGILGALLGEQAGPVRTDHVGEHPLATGFPPHHPPMESFLGVPVRVRGQVFGNLYVTEHVDGAFTAEDEELVAALAAMAGTAIANARLFEETRYRARWSSALVEASRAAVGDGDPVPSLVGTALRLAEADVAWVSLVEDGGLRVVHAVGGGADALVGRPDPVASGGSGALDLEHVATAPFSGLRGVRGVLGLARGAGGSDFLDRDQEMVESCAVHVGVVLGQARMLDARERATLQEDRRRIARDLHDHVVQRIYATGLRLSAIAGGLDGVPAEQVRAQAEELDTTILQIRQAIHALRAEAPGSPRTRLARLVDGVAGFSTAPELVLRGPVDTVVTPEVLLDLEAVVREALSNAVRHGGAGTARVEVVASVEQVSVTVTDDGSGIGEVTRTGGLRNLRERALAHGGALRVENADTGGTALAWSALLAAPRSGGDDGDG